MGNCCIKKEIILDEMVEGGIRQKHYFPDNVYRDMVKSYQQTQKKHYKKQCGDKWICQQCKQEFTQLDAHHDGEQFEQIHNNFEKEFKNDENVRKNFQKYHAEHAKYLFLCRQCHFKIDRLTEKQLAKRNEGQLAVRDTK